MSKIFLKGIEFLFQESSAATAKPRRPTNSLGMTLVRIEPGSFLMGSSKDQIDHLVRVFPDSKREWFGDEQPQHTVKVTHPFYLGTHQVTQGQYPAAMGDNPSHYKGSGFLPVENVSWLDAVKFCNKLSEREKRTPFYRIDGTEVTTVGGDGYRLPTEAEPTPDRAGVRWRSCAPGRDRLKRLLCRDGQDRAGFPTVPSGYGTVAGSSRSGPRPRACESGVRENATRRPTRLLAVNGRQPPGPLPGGADP